MAAYADTTDAILRFAGNNEAEALSALSAGAHDIDAALRSGGYSAPVDTSALTTTDGVRLVAKLRDINLALAAGILSRGQGTRRGTPDKVRKDYKDARDWLDRVREGKELLTALVPVSGSSVLAIAGDHEWGHTADYLDLATVVD